MMLEGNRLSYVVPGYTGHIPKNIAHLSEPPKSDTKGQIPGYGGFVPSIKSENLFGRTFGRTTQIVTQGEEYNKGLDVEVKTRYTSLQRETFINQRDVRQRTAAEIVGVNHTQGKFRAPLPPEDVNKFWGLDGKPAGTQFYETVHTLSKADRGRITDGGRNENLDDALSNFFGVDKSDKSLRFGEPIPGYTGTLKRVAADNIFGLSYAQALNKGKDSDHKIHDDRMRNLKAQSQRIPPVKR
eukprot:TRINITY_DN8996_c0_g2_i2.p1 TRINITY_DN8996_c0_g2~~TRINITY_DN8996_c0_g2_i2.p1  ORF type:complete len:241 (+),score=50.42 TRINITY_DN8996_c0_g2_i2:75-797(+)